MSLLGVTYRSVAEGVTYRSRNDAETAASPRPIPAWVAAHRAGTLELTAQPGGSSTGWRVSIPSDSVGLTSSEQLHWFVSSRQLV